MLKRLVVAGFRWGARPEYAVGLAKGVIEQIFKARATGWKGEADPYAYRWLLPRLHRQHEIDRLTTREDLEDLEDLSQGRKPRARVHPDFDLQARDLEEDSEKDIDDELRRHRIEDDDWRGFHAIDPQDLVRGARVLVERLVREARLTG